ncbi:MAG: cytochrome c [Pseudolabrys sp.]
MNRLFAGLLCLTLVALAHGASAGDPQAGERMARRWCAACHVVAADQTRGSTVAPPFSAIAAKPGFDESKLALFLLLPHPRMPDMNMSRDEAANLAAYILSQKK